MNRRAAMLALAALAAASGLHAKTRKVPRPRIAFVSNRNKAGGQPYIERFVAGMKSLGYVQNRNYALDVYYAMNEQSRIAAAIKEAVRNKPDILIVTGLYAARQAR